MRSGLKARKVVAAEVEVGVGGSRLQEGAHHLFGGAGVGGAFQYNELARAQVLGDGLSRSLDV